MQERVAEQSTENATHDNEIYTLWLNDNWYIPIDQYGRCVGACGEGALGFIVQLLSTDDHGSVMALKLPRMVAETHRENAYISELLSQERATVNHIFTRDDDNKGINIAGLLPANPTFDPLRTPLTIRSLRNEAKEWNDALIFVRFEKGQNPYFCLVKSDLEKVFPPQAKAPKLNKSQYEQIRAISGSAVTERTSRDWEQVVFVTQADRSVADEHHEQNVPSGISLFNITDALSPVQVSQKLTWYTCVPSVAYTWAPHTFQEAIGLGSRGKSWHLNQHLALIEQIANGVSVLHHKGMLHADIRPANIVHLQDPKNPERYYLSDYGSFATTNVFPVGRYDAEPAGTTIIGPVVEGERTSAFYAPERQSGRERETADMAIVVPLPAGDRYYLLVGWKSDFHQENLIDRRSQPLRTADEFVDYIEEKREEHKSKRSPRTSLHMGDRIQLRDYVFELADEECVLEKMQLFVCKKIFWTVYHTKIVIHENKPFERCYAFPIPRIIELPQWSAATDIYGIGVLCLYSLYADVYDDSLLADTTLTTHHELNDRESDWDESSHVDLDSESGVSTVDVQISKSRLTHQQPAMPTTDSGQRDSGPITSEIDNEENWSAVDKLDKGFERMLNYLSDESLFNAVWPKLERIRHQIEVKLMEPGQYTAATLAEVPFVPTPVTHRDAAEDTQDDLDAVQDDSSDQPEPKSLRTEAEAVVTQITSTVPGIERLLKPLLEERTNDVHGNAREQGKVDSNDAESGNVNTTPSATAAANDDLKHIYQLGPFIFFMHFVLRCLHRQDSMTEEQQMLANAQEEERWMSVPFCKDRHEPPNSGAIDDVLARLREIRPLIEMGALKGLWTEKIATFDLRPENEIRGELSELKEEKKRWEADKRKLKTRREEMKGEHIELVTASMNRTLAQIEAATVLDLLMKRSNLISEIRNHFLATLTTFDGSTPR